MCKITVITPTNRGDEALTLVIKSLKQQTFKDFEWILQRPDSKPEGLAWTLNRDYNTAIRKAKGDLIISWQDYTYAKPDTLERFYDHFTTEPNTLVTAVGNKYENESWTVLAWKDPRIRDDQGTYYPCYFSDIEWNLCSIPKNAIYSVGGFDESLDTKYGMDGFSVNDRINLMGGYDFKIDQSIKSYSIPHSRPENWEKNNWIHEYNKVIHPRYIANPSLTFLK